MKKSILFISPTGTLDNGAEISITNLMAHLSKSGHKVYNAFPYVDKNRQKDYLDFCNQNNIDMLPVEILKWWWPEAPGGMPGTTEQLGYMYRENITSIRNFILENKIEMVITNTANMFQGAVSASCEGIPHIWLIHEFPNGEFEYFKEKLSFIDQFSESIFAVSGALTQDLQNRLSHRTIQSFSPYTAISNVQLQHSDKNRIVCVGRLTERKNQLELLKAYSLIEKQINMELVFIGGWDEQYKRICDQYIKENHLKNILFIGNVDNPWSMFTDKDICVLPAKMETFGLVYIEAVLNAVPVIFSDNPGHMSAFQLSKTGTFYTSGNVNELSDKILSLISNFNSEKERTHVASKSMKENYQLEKVYATLINRIEDENLGANDSLKSIEGIFTNINLREQKQTSNRYFRKFLKIRNWLNRVKRRS